MCGIIGYTGRKNAVPVLISGLHSLEYRGYDSAGIAVMDGGAVTCVKAKGRIANVESLLESRPHELSSHTGIGHTRWATHGAPSDENSHPHGTELVYAVHNGIIENYAELRERLAGLGYRFRSETDTEAAVCLIDYHYRQTGDPKEALAAATRELRGSWALGVLFADRDGELYAVRHENPLVAASDETGSYIASDITALLEHTDRYIRLDEDEIAVLCADGIRVYGADGAPVEKEVQTVTWNRDAARRGGFPHYMLKEIHEEPETIRKTVGAGTRGGFPDFGAGNVDMAALDRAEHIYIVACGTAMHAGLIGKQLIERFSGIPVSVEIASEFRYGAPIVSENDLFIAISQSGETADTACQIARHVYAFYCECGRFERGARIGRGDLYLCRAGNRGRQYKGIYRAAFRFVSARGAFRLLPRQAFREGSVGVRFGFEKRRAGCRCIRHCEGGGA